MANYNELDVNSTSYQRAKSIHVTNEYGKDPYVSFSEELVVELPGNEAAHKELGVVGEGFTATNKDEVVTLVDPVTGNPSAETITYAEIYNALRSLYLHLANKRDQSLAQLEADRLAAIAAIDTAVSAALADALAAQATAEAALTDTNTAVSANDPLAATTAATAASTAASTASASASIANQEAAKPLASSTAKTNAIAAQAASTAAQAAATSAQTAAASIQV